MIQSAVKLGKTVLTPTTAFRNIYGNIPMAISNGDFAVWSKGWRKASKEAIDSFASYHDIDGNERKWDEASEKQMREWLALQTKRGIINDSARGEEIAMAMRDVKFREGAYRILSDPEGALAILNASAAERSSLSRKLGWDKAERMLHVAKRFYGFGDDFFRIVADKLWTKRFMEWGSTREEAMEKSAERVREIYPSYSYLPRLVHAIRRFPLVGPFVSFQTSVFITAYHRARHIKNDLKSDNPGIRSHARKRAVAWGLTFPTFAALHYGTMYMVASSAAGMFDEGEDWDERMAKTKEMADAIGSLDAPFREHSWRMFLGLDDEGRMSFVDFTHMNYDAMFNQILATSAMDIDDATLLERGGSVLKYMVGPYFGPEMLVGPFWEWATNENAYGAKLHHPEAPALEKAVSLASHMTERALPGIATTPWRIGKAAVGQTTSTGRDLRLVDELSAMAGFRVSSLDPKRALEPTGRAFTRRASYGRSKFYRVFIGRDSSSSDIRTAFRRSSDYVLERLGDATEDARRGAVIGITDGDALRQLREGGMSKEMAIHAIRGKVPRTWKPLSESGVKAAYEAMLDRRIGREEAIGRIRLLKSMMREGLWAEG